MKLASLLAKIKRVLFLLKEKGIRYTYNYITMHIFYGTRNPFLVKLLYWLEPYPSYIELEVTTRCNLKCKICEHTYWQEVNKDMTFEQFMHIMNQFPKLKWIGLTGIGESFLHKDFLKMLKYVKSKNIYVELYDNFYFIDKKTAKELVEMGVDKMIVSFDAATKETYEKIRVGSNFERVVNNIRNLIQLKKEMNKHFPEISFHYIINRLNVQEAPKYVELVSSLSQGEGASVLFTRMLHKFKEINDLFIEVSEEVIQKAEKKAKELGVKLTWNTDVPSVKPPINRCTVWLMPFIFVTGHVIPCCNANEAGRREFQKRTAMGNIFEQSFKDIWYGEKYRNFRKMLRQGKTPLICNDCAAFKTKKEKQL